MVEKNLDVRRGLLTNLESLAGDMVNLHADKGDAKYVLAAIDVITEQQAEIRDLTLNKNRVESVAHGSILNLLPAELVAQPDGLQALANSDVFAKSFGGDHPVNFAAGIANGDGVGGATVFTGVFVNDSGYVFVKGGESYAFADLIKHGRLVMEDEVVLSYLFKYLSKSIRAAA